jgi:hypothetical protein
MELDYYKTNTKYAFDDVHCSIFALLSKLTFQVLLPLQIFPKFPIYSWALQEVSPRSVYTFLMYAS